MLVFIISQFPCNSDLFFFYGADAGHFLLLGRRCTPDFPSVRFLSMCFVCPHFPCCGCVQQFVFLGLSRLRSSAVVPCLRSFFVVLTVGGKHQFS